MHQPGPGQGQPQQFTVTGEPWRSRRRPVSQQPGKRRVPWAYRAAGAATAVIICVTALADGGHAAAHASRPLVPPPLAACVPGLVPCYGQDPLHEAYGMGVLYARGITGAGTTVAVIDDGADPQVRADLAAFSRFFRLPPAWLRVLPWGHGAPGPIDPAAAREDTADLELIHFMAPGARLLYVQVSPSAGPRAAMAALGAVAASQHIDVVSLSWGIPEAATSRGQVLAMRAGLVSAAGDQVSVIAATGDSGPTWPGLHIRAVAWPASDPLVTGVGAVTLHLGPGGRRLRPDTVTGGTFATGAGLSAIFGRPAYQDAAASVAGGHRGVADVSMDCAMQVYVPFPRDAARGQGWVPDCGTSFSAPLFAGIADLAAQVAGHPLGPLNPALYRMRGTADGVLDVTSGSNTDHGVPGFAAGPGYDLPSGIGTVGNATRFVFALGRLSPQPSPAQPSLAAADAAGQEAAGPQPAAHKLTGSTRRVTAPPLCRSSPVRNLEEY